MKIEKPTKTVLLSKVFHAIPEARLPEIFDAIARMAGTGIETMGGLEAILEDGSQRYLQAMAGRSTYHPFLGFLDIALIIRGLTRVLEPTFEFLRVLKAANPRLSAWPIGQVTDTRADEAEQPHFLNDRFEAYLYYPYSSAQRRRGTLDFMIFDPIEADFFSTSVPRRYGGLPTKVEPPEPSRSTFRLAKWRKRFPVGRSFARTLGSGPETTLSFCFRWSGIKSRKIDLYRRGLKSVASHLNYVRP